MDLPEPLMKAFAGLDRLQAQLAEGMNRLQPGPVRDGLAALIREMEEQRPKAAAAVMELRQQATDALAKAKAAVAAAEAKAAEPPPAPRPKPPPEPPPPLDRALADKLRALLWQELPPDRAGR